MERKKEESGYLLKAVLSMLSSDIAEVSIKEKDDAIEFYKYGVQFCIIKDNAVYLVDKTGRFRKVPHDVVSEPKKFLQEAIESFYVAMIFTGLCCINKKG